MVSGTRSRGWLTNDVEVSKSVVLVVHVEPGAGGEASDDLAVVAGLEGVAQRVRDGGHAVTPRHGNRMPVRRVNLTVP